MLKNIYVGLLLHFYQPWWQFPHVLRRIIDECYAPIFTELIPEIPGFCFTANMNYSLMELLENERREDNGKASAIIDSFRTAVGQGKIELLGSTAYHPIMPLIPDELQRIQLSLDTELKSSCWRIRRNCNGIFLPEMAFSQKIIPNLKKERYSWTVLEDIPFCVQYGYAPFDHIATVGGFRLFFRSNHWSNQISWNKLDFDTLRAKMNYEIPDWTKNQPAYIILAMDAETFGHHHKHLIKTILKPMIEEWGEKNILCPIEQIGQMFPARNFASISDGSWSTNKDDYHQNNFFPLWKSNFNVHHQDLWQLINTAIRHFGKSSAALSQFLKMSSSCHSWWISGRPNWEPEFMKPAARIAMKIIHRHGTEEDILKAEKILERLISLKK